MVLGRLVHITSTEVSEELIFWRSPRHWEKEDLVAGRSRGLPKSEFGKAFKRKGLKYWTRSLTGHTNTHRVSSFCYSSMWFLKKGNYSSEISRSTFNSTHICSHEAFAGVFKDNAKKYNTAFHPQRCACQHFQSLRHKLPAAPSSHLWHTLVVQDVVLRYWERSWLISHFSTGRKNNTVSDKDPITSHCMCLTALECHCCFQIYK